MIPRMLQSGRSFRGAMSYNVEKVFGGVASLVAYRNLPDGNLHTAWDRFQELEDNPMVSTRTTCFGWHVAISPGVEDTINEEGVIALVDELMEHMGYGGQPYLLYRHNDIEREHYHIVSVRVRDDGSAIRDYHYREGREMVRFMRKLEKKYGYSIPAGYELDEKENVDLEQVRPLAVVPKRFKPDGLDVKRQLVTIFNEALSWNVLDFAQLYAVLDTMGVRVRKTTRKDGGENLMLQGVDEYGKGISRRFSMERDFGVDAMGGFERAVDRSGTMRDTVMPSYLKTLSVLETVMEKAGSLDEFCCMCRECGLGAVSVMTRGTGKIAGVMLCEKAGKAVFYSDEFGESFSANAMRRLIDEGIWHTADKDEMERNRQHRLLTRSDIEVINASINERLASLENKTHDTGESQSQGFGLKLK